MLRLAILFLVIALIAAFMGFGGSDTATGGGRTGGNPAALPRRGGDYEEGTVMQDL